MSTLTPVWLQRPKKEGGFGFTVLGTATCKPFHLLSNFALSMPTSVQSLLHISLD